MQISSTVRFIRSCSVQKSSDKVTGAQCLTQVPLLSMRYIQGNKILHNLDLNSLTSHILNAESSTDCLFYPQAAFILYMLALLLSSTAFVELFIPLFSMLKSNSTVLIGKYHNMYSNFAPWVRTDWIIFKVKRCLSIEAKTRIKFVQINVIPIKVFQVSWLHMYIIYLNSI